MGFFDLNIPYQESDRHATDKSTLKGRRLKLALKAMELGYTGVAYNRILKGVMSESDRCSTGLFPLSKFTASSSSSFVSAVKFHREMLNVAVSSAFRQYTRLTVIVDSPAQASALNSGNPILRSYDIVSVRPVNQNAFDQACQTSEVDIIAIDFSDKLPFRLKQHMVKAAIKRGVYFEITYSGLIADAQSRRQMISNCKLLVDWTRGQNLIICSAASSASELRGPRDVANLFSLLGLSIERAKAAISKNCRSLLGNVLRKKNFYKEAVKVEKISSVGQVNVAQPAFDDWLHWDPISSGEGDMLLDDIEKSFAISKTVKDTGKTFDFTSNLNGLPAHGLQIKDLIGLTNAALKSAHNDISVCASMEIEDATALQKPEDQAGLNVLSGLHSKCAAMRKEQGHVILPTFPVLSPGGLGPAIHLNSACKDLQLPLNVVSEEHELLPLEKRKDQTPPCDENLGYGPSACAAEPSISPLSPCNSTGTNGEIFLSASIKNLNTSEDSEVKLVASETDLQGRLSPLCDGNDFNGGEQVHITKVIGPVTNNQEFSEPLNKSLSPALILEQVSLENQCDGGICTEEGVAEDKVPSKIRSECETLPLASTDTGSQDVNMIQEQCEVVDGFVRLSDGMPFEGILNLGTDKEQNTCRPMGDQNQIKSARHYQVHGQKRRKQNSPHRPFLFPFKHFSSPRSLKRKSRKLKH